MHGILSATDDEALRIKALVARGGEAESDRTFTMGGGTASDGRHPDDDPDVIRPRLEPFRLTGELRSALLRVVAAQSDDPVSMHLH